ncbi:MAG: polysaccharide pyruvyl transferase family protein [Bdellovibrionales bacterium]|nr:polysaccharide pyruvyl transferase family protein [Bdellovibrionales bacterium]
MKGPIPRISLLGNNSGRNLGDAAILASILDILSDEIPEAEFYVPSTHPHFITSNYGDKYNVKAVNVMPWTGSLRLLGIPTFYYLMRSDIALICDGIIFGKKLFNPAFNFLITLIFVVPWARLCGTKMVCYSCGIGPFPSKISEIFARWVMNGSDLVILRENDSLALARKIGVTVPIEVTGDAAFLNKVSPEAKADEMLKELSIPSNKPLLGVNITKYFDSWLEADERLSSREQFLDELAKGINEAVLALKEQSGEEIVPVVFSTQPMDEPTCHALANKIGAKVVDNSRYLSHDIQAMMRRCGLFIGMRFHSVVLAAAVETPLIALIYAPKVRGFMRQVDCEEYAIELAALDANLLRDKIVSGWNNRESLRLKQKEIVDQLKSGARNAARTVKKRYFSEAVSSPTERPRFSEESPTP